MERRTQDALKRAFGTAHRTPLAPRGGLTEPPCTLTDKQLDVIVEGIRGYIMLAHETLKAWDFLLKIPVQEDTAALRRDLQAGIERAIGELEALKPFTEKIIKYASKCSLLYYRLFAIADDIADARFREEMKSELATLIA